MQLSAWEQLFEVVQAIMIMCSEVSKGIAQISLNTETPVMFGVLTTDTIEQAIERAGSKAGNKGSECAQELLKW